MTKTTVRARCRRPTGAARRCKVSTGQFYLTQRDLETVETERPVRAGRVVVHEAAAVKLSAREGRDIGVHAVLTRQHGGAEAQLAVSHGDQGASRGRGRRHEVHEPLEQRAGQAGKAVTARVAEHRRRQLPVVAREQQTAAAAAVIEAQQRQQAGGLQRLRALVDEDRAEGEPIHLGPARPDTRRAYHIRFLEQRPPQRLQPASSQPGRRHRLPHATVRLVVGGCGFRRATLRFRRSLRRARRRCVQPLDLLERLRVLL